MDFIQIGTKRPRENEDLEADRTKKSKVENLEITIHNLLEELIMQILIRVPKKNLESLSEVSKQWHRITRSRDFWRLSCHYKWTSVLASDNLDFLQEDNIIPIITLTNGKTLVDWRSYFKLRKKFCKALQSLADQSSAIAGLLNTQLGKIIALGDELLLSSVDMYLDVLPFLYLGRFLFDVPLVANLDFVFDLAMLCNNRKNWRIIPLLDNIIFDSPPADKVFSFCRRAYDLLIIVRDNEPEKIKPLIRVTAKLFKSMSVFDERCRKLYTLVTEYMIGLGQLSLDKQQQVDDEVELVFKYPFSSGDGQFLLKTFATIKGFVCMAVDIASRLYYATDDWKIKASAIAVSWNKLKKTKKQFYRMAVDAAKQPQKELAFAGLVGLYKFVKKSTYNEGHFNVAQATELFSILATSLITYGPIIGLQLYATMLSVLPHVDPDLVSDELLHQIMTNILNVFAQQDPDVESPEDESVYSCFYLGKKFSTRLINSLENVKTTLFSMSVRFSPSRLLECYVSFGMAVQGDKFVPEFKQLTKQIDAGTLPFKVSVNKCYARLIDLYMQFSESDEEREKIVQALVDSIPKEVLEFGQSGVFEEEQLPEAGPYYLPYTYQEMLEQYECDGIERVSLPPTAFRASNHFVQKEHLTPVNPSGIIRADKGEGIKKKTIDSFLYSSRLLTLVLKSGSKYIKHAQDVLHAMLAALRIFSPNSTQYTVLARLLGLVKPEMDPMEFVKYVDIVLHIMAEKIDTEDLHSSQTCKEMFNLFTFCMSSLESCDVVGASTIRYAINAYLKVRDVQDQKRLEVNELIYYCITTWPRNAYEAIHESNLADWLVTPVKEAERLEEKAPLLNIFATAVTFYGIDFALVALCIDDPDKEDIESADQYLVRIMPDCRALYIAASNGDIKMTDMQVKLLRNFLVLYALYLANDDTAKIGMLTKIGDNEAEGLLKAMKSDKPFDTGVPELNELFKGLDLVGICKELSLKQVEPKENKK